MRLRSICAQRLKRFVKRSSCLNQRKQKGKRRDRIVRQAENGPAAEPADIKRAAEVSAALDAKAWARLAAAAGEGRPARSENARLGPVQNNQACTRRRIRSNN